MFIKKSNACPCGYCEHFDSFEYYDGNILVQKGVCIKHALMREVGDELCEDFILNSAIHTNKWYPGK